MVSRVAQEVLRIVQQQHVDRLEPEPAQRSPELISQKLRMQAVPDPVGVLDHLRKRPPLGLALDRQLQVRSLEVTDLGDHHHFVAWD